MSCSQKFFTEVFSASNEDGVASLRAEVSTSAFNPLYQFPGTLKGGFGDSRKRKKAKKRREGRKEGGGREGGEKGGWRAKSWPLGKIQFQQVKPE